MMNDKIFDYLNRNLKPDIVKTEIDHYKLRDFQIEALKSIIRKYRYDNKFLLGLAPGTGKSIVLVAILKLLITSGLINRSLILVSNKCIQDSLLQIINKLLPDFYAYKLDDKSANHKYAKLVISTVGVVTRDRRYCTYFKETDFDLTVFFDIGQYITGNLLQLANYFNGYKLGFMDPSQIIVSSDIDNFDNKKERDTYNFFDKEIGQTDFIYSLPNAVRDGYLINPLLKNKSMQMENIIYNKIIEKISRIKMNLRRSGDNYKKFYSDIKDIELLIKGALDKEKENKELVEELIKNGITKSDIKEITYKKEQLNEFHRLLNDNEYFYYMKLKKGGTERVWQDFFEANTWIFGYGLNFIFSSSLKDRKLEEVISGFDFNDFGKRVDALMVTRGVINSFVFVEIKPHNSKLLASKAYRKGCWQISNELSGAVSQIQKTVQKAITSIKTKTDIKSENGDPTGEVVFLYQPKSFIVIGNLSEFKSDHGVNEGKFSSFELFRKSISNTEIITYDELYKRTKYIIGHYNNQCISKS